MSAGNGTCGLLSFIAAREGKSFNGARLKTRDKDVFLPLVVDDEDDAFDERVARERFKGRGKDDSRREEQSLKASFSIVLIPSPNRNSSSPKQSWKALSPTTSTESGSSTDLSELHAQKAHFSIFLIPLPNRNSLSPKHQEKASSPTTSTESGIATDLSDLHP